MRQKFYKSYMESEILNADPLELVRLLYRGAIERIGEARQCLGRRDIAGRIAAVIKATDIINELLLAIDRERGGDIAARLVELYDYMLRRINEGNFQQADAPFAEVENLLRTLAEAWAQASQGGPEPEPAGNGRQYERVSCAG